MSILVENVCFQYESAFLLNQLSFYIEQGEIVTLIGASGSGKTTIFRLLNGLDRPDSGFLSVADIPLPEGHKKVSCMMQQDMLLPWRTALKNVTLAYELGKVSNGDVIKARALLKELGLENFENYYPYKLSGGMRQRVSLGRALLQGRPVLLLDEPFGSLDVCLREQLYVLLRNVRDKYGTTILLVTHDFHDAFALSDRVLLLKKGCIHQEWNLSNKSPSSRGIAIEEMRQSILT